MTARPAVTALLFTAAAAVVILIATRHGVGVSPDSLVYRAMAAGTTHTAHFPPGYPWLLRVASDRTIAVLSFASLIGVSAYALGATVAFVLLTTPALVYVCSWAWSEPPFLVALLVFLLALSRRRYAVAAPAAVTLILLRHVGITALPVLAFEVWRERGWRAAAWHTVPAALSLVLLRAARVYAWHPPSAADWHELAVTAALAVAPLRGVAWVVMVVALGVAVVARRLAIRPPRDAFTRAALLWCGVYVVLVIAARAVADSIIPFDRRIFAPVVVTLLIVAARGVHVGGTLGRVPAALWLAVRAVVTAAFVVGHR